MGKCTSEAHKEEDASSYCKIFMCKECEKYHQILFSKHHQCKLDNNKDNNTEIFTGICGEKNHSSELKFFCKTHNKLCCGECIIKIKENSYGEHKDCDICLIEVDLNNREDELLMQVDNNFDLLLNENMIKESENLHNKIKITLEKGKLIVNQWDKEKLNSLITNCLNIENNINDIEIVNKKIKKGKIENPKFSFYSEGENQISELIKKFGMIFDNNLKFDSLIEFDAELIKSWLNNREFNSELLFRKSRDGSTTNDFHDKCDNKGNTIVFIETTKGYKFGGYTELQWDKSGYGKKDNSTFIFSFNNKQKYTARNDNNSIFCSNNYTPRFGNYNYPEIYFNTTLNKGQSYLSTSSTFLIERKLTNREEYWDVKELEVFKINYK